MLYQTLLAMMITVAPPGQSAHSVVVEPSCGADPSKPACDLTPKPRWSPYYKSFVRKETREEALQRYIVIAKAIEKVATAMTTPVKGADGAEGPPAFPWATKDLAQALVTIANHESGFRRDVHSGVGPAALGDCTYWDVKGRPVSLERARKMSAVIRSSCNSVCLMQLNTGGLERSAFGFMGKEMVGLDEAATERCLTAGARAFTAAQGRCAATRTHDWFARSVTSYGTGGRCQADDEWIKARANTFDRIGKISVEALPPDARALLGMVAGAPAAPGR